MNLKHHSIRATDVVETGAGVERSTGRTIMKRSKTVLAMLAGGLWLWTGAAMAADVTDVRFSDEGEQLRFILSTDSPANEPRVFTTAQPPRIVLELPETGSKVPASAVQVGVGPVRAYTALSAGGRTRLVVDLERQTGYEVDVDGSQVVLTVDARGRVATASSGSRFEIEGVDFRRGPEGESLVTVDMNQPGVNLSVDERASMLRVDLFDTQLPERLMQQLDVTDFATPVQSITPEARGNNARLNIDIAGAFDHVAYQTGDQLVVEIKRPEVEPRMARELEFFQEREYSGDRITLNFQDIAVRSVLQLIADISDLNIVVSDSVSGNLTLRLTNVPWDQALNIILETRNLSMRESGNVRWVAPAAEIAAREQQILRARAERETLEPLRTVMIPVSYANAESLRDLIEASRTVGGTDARSRAGLLSERGSVTIDQRTNTLLVTDTTEQIERVRSLVAELDRPVRQVLIESRIVIARSTFNHELGVRFGVSGSQQAGNNLISLSGSNEATDRMSNVGLARRQFLNQRPGRPTFLPDADPPDDGGALDVGTAGILVPALQDRLNVNLPVANAAGAFGVSFLTSNYLLDLELSALEAQGDGEVISTPRVITSNQREAFIQQGVEIPFQEATSSGATNVEFKEAILELRATPLITPDNRVQMDLNVKQDTVGATLTPGLEPSIDTREVNTSLLVENGQTVVLGGIFQEERNFDSQKVPLLGDLPVVGTLFRRRATSDEKRELLIFVTPTILDEQVRID